MKKEHLEFLVCPETGRPLLLEVIEAGSNDRVKEGALNEPISGKRYPIVNFIPRFVPAENYASNFGYQWNLHRNTQQDEYAQITLSKDRYFNETRWGNNLRGQLIVEVGSGAGRFTKHAVSTGATIISLDYSNAVEANYQINGQNDNLLIIQADVYFMPFKRNSFDKIFCFGMLQHTPNPEKSFYNIVSYLKEGGEIASDIYLKSWKDFFHARTYVRLFTKSYQPEKLYEFTRKYVDFFWPLAKLLRKTRAGQKFISRIIADRSDILPNSDDDLLKEWTYLDTFDWFSPAYDFPQTLRRFLGWHKNANLIDIDVHYGYNGIEGRGVRGELN